MSQSETNIMYSWILNSKCTVVRYMGKFLYGLRFNWIVCNTFIYHIIFFHRIMICTHLFNANMRFYMEFQNYFLFSIAFSVNTSAHSFQFYFYFFESFLSVFLLYYLCDVFNYKFYFSSPSQVFFPRNMIYSQVFTTNDLMTARATSMDHIEKNHLYNHDIVLVVYVIESHVWSYHLIHIFYGFHFFKIVGILWFSCF